MKKNEALMTRARRINPVPADAFKNLALSSEAQETLDTILQTALSTDRKEAALTPRAMRRPLSATSSPRPTNSLRTMAIKTVAITAAAAVVFGITTLGTSDRPGRGADRVWAAELVSIAEASPRFLIQQEGWAVASVDEFRADYGEMTFQNGPNAMDAGGPPGLYWMDLHWVPAAEHESLVKDRSRGASASWQIEIAGHEAVLFQHQPTAPIGTTFYAMWLQGGHSMELRTDVIPTVDEFKAVAATLQTVDVDTWLSAMPASVVKPDEREDAVDKILARLPVPASLDVEALKQSEMVRSDSSLDYDVMNAVVCGWIQQWVDGTKAGDERAVREAVASIGWPGWAERDNHGQWSSFLSDIAEGMKTNTPVNGDRSLPIGVTYQRHIGCPEA